MSLNENPSIFTDGTRERKNPIKKPKQLTKYSIEYILNPTDVTPDNKTFRWTISRVISPKSYVSTFTGIEITSTLHTVGKKYEKEGEVEEEEDHDASEEYSSEDDYRSVEEDRNESDDENDEDYVPVETEDLLAESLMISDALPFQGIADLSDLFQSVSLSDNHRSEPVV